MWGSECDPTGWAPPPRREAGSGLGMGPLLLGAQYHAIYVGPLEPAFITRCPPR